MSNTRKCPGCGEWIPLPVRRPLAAFNAHIKKEHPELAAKQAAFAKELLGDATGEFTIGDLDAAKVDVGALALTVLEMQRLKTLETEYETATGVRRAQLGNQIKALKRKTGELK